jgi:NAD(P)-dependent dehydrogenase (short-subunit alcohol dehydrogenase family)
VSSLHTFYKLRELGLSTRLFEAAASKAALRRITRNLTGDLSPRGIRVNAVSRTPEGRNAEGAGKSGSTLNQGNRFDEAYWPG